MIGLAILWTCIQVPDGWQSGRDPSRYTRYCPVVAKGLSNDHSRLVVTAALQRTYPQKSGHVQDFPQTLALYRMRVRGGSGRRRDALRASGKAVWAWPPVGAAGAGSMQIQ